MLSTFLGGAERKAEKKAKKDVSQDKSIKEARDLFNIGRFPVVTTQIIENRPIAKVLGLVCCRGFDSEEAFFGMAAMAVKKGAQGIIGYNENVAFHPDGSKYFSCFGTAVMFQREGRSDLLSDTRTIKETLRNIPNAPEPSQESYSAESLLDTEDRLSLQIPTKETSKVVSSTDTITKEVPLPSQLSNALSGELRDEIPNDLKGSKLGKLQGRMVDADTSSGKVSHVPNASLGNNPTAHGARIAQPSEDEDPVLQRLLASQKRQAGNAWQQ